MKAFRILFEDEWILVVDKPAGFHCHPPENKNIKMHPAWNGLKILENQIQQKLYPAHRLDRATSGIFLLTKNAEVAAITQKQFQDKNTAKTYLCVVRGNLSKAALLDSPLKRPSGELMPAITQIMPYCQFTLPIEHPEGGDRIFTMVRANPITGRFHQIRRHLALLGFPIVGDKQHGDKKLNRQISELINTDRQFLRAMRLEFDHPVLKSRIVIKTKWSKDWHKLFEFSNVCPLLDN